MKIRNPLSFEQSLRNNILKQNMQCLPENSDLEYCSVFL